MSLVVEIRLLNGEAAFVPHCRGCGARGERIGRAELLIVEALGESDPVGEWMDSHRCI